MRNFYFILFVFISLTTYSQKKSVKSKNSVPNTNIVNQPDSVFSSSQLQKSAKPPISLYKIYTLERDTTFVDTTLNIQKEYKFNFLRKDIFGLLPFANEGHTYNALVFQEKSNFIFPNIGFKAKHYNYQEVENISYYSVPTPLSDLYYKTVMEQGQSLDAFLTVNTKPNFNFSIAYKGLRSNGKYINNIASSGNFRFTTSYFTKNKRYFLNAHFTGQDISNQENGGIIDISLFESSEEPFNERDRLEVYFRDATSLLKGNRFFIDHSFKLSKNKDNSLVLFHQFNHEYKFFEFTQPTISNRFGTSYTNSINNKTRYNHLYNKFGIGFTTKKYGYIVAFIDNNSYNYFYKSVVYDNLGNVLVPNAINDRITSIGGKYTLLFDKLKVNVDFSNTLSNQSLSNITAKANYRINDDFNFQFTYLKSNSLPNLNFTLYQSDYVAYNWFNNFKTEKTNSFSLSAYTKWFNLEGKYSVLNDFLYFYNTTEDITNLLVKPFQYDKTINYYSLKINKEIKYGKFALDNTILYQNVGQNDAVLNVPDLVFRNTLYFSEHVFKKAMFIQTGFTLNYFTSYYIDDYNPLIGEFYTQRNNKIGDFPMVDFFINAKVRQTRIFLKAEHFNSAWTGYDFYSAPNYPYRDFLIRFGLVWNFFK